MGIKFKPIYCLQPISIEIAYQIIWRILPKLGLYIGYLPEMSLVMSFLSEVASPCT